MNWWIYLFTSALADFAGEHRQKNATQQVWRNCSLHHEGFRITRGSGHRFSTNELVNKLLSSWIITGWSRGYHHFWTNPYPGWTCWIHFFCAMNESLTDHHWYPSSVLGGNRWELTHRATTRTLTNGWFLNGLGIWWWLLIIINGYCLICDWWFVIIVSLACQVNGIND